MSSRFSILRETDVITKYDIIMFGAFYRLNKILNAMYSCFVFIPSLLHIPQTTVRQEKHLSKPNTTNYIGLITTNICQLISLVDHFYLAKKHFCWNDFTGIRSLSLHSLQSGHLPCWWSHRSSVESWRIVIVSSSSSSPSSMCGF